MGRCFLADPNSWKFTDIAEAVKALNANASTFPGVQFVGWISGAEGNVRVAVKDLSSGPTSYGIVRIGRVIRTQEQNGQGIAPFRDSEFLVEVHMSTLHLHRFESIFGSALSALSNNLPVEYDVQDQLWESPQDFTPPSADVPYYSGMASVPYYAA